MKPFLIMLNVYTYSSLQCYFVNKCPVVLTSLHSIPLVSLFEFFLIMEQIFPFFICWLVVFQTQCHGPTSAIIAVLHQDRAGRRRHRRWRDPRELGGLVDCCHWALAGLTPMHLTVFLSGTNNTFLLCTM